MGYCLDIDHCTIYQLHHLSEHFIGGLVQLLEVDFLVGLE